jgi:hypothetical protein
LTDPNYVVLLVSMFLMAGSFSLLTYYSPPRLQEAGVSRPWIGPVHAIGVIFEIVLFQWQPGLLRRWNYTGVILAGCVTLTLRQLLFAFSDNAWVLSEGTGPLFANAVAGRLANQSGDSLSATFLFAAALAALAGIVVGIRGRRLDRAGMGRPPA